MKIKFKYALSVPVILLGVYIQTSASSAHMFPWIAFVASVVNDNHQYQFSDLTGALHKKGQLLIDFEQGLTLPVFTNIDLGNTSNYRDALQRILSSQGLAYEMHGPAMLIYDVKQRASGDEYPLNRKISNLKVSNVSLEQCFAEIGQQLDVTILGSGPYFPGTGPNPTFEIELDDITLQNALFLIVSKSKNKMWIACPWPSSNNKKAITIQVY